MKSWEYFKPARHYYRTFIVNKIIYGVAFMVAPKNSCWYSNTKDCGTNSRVDTLVGFSRIYNRMNRNYSYHLNVGRIKIAGMIIQKGG